MKKYLSLLFLAVFGFSLISCDDDNDGYYDDTDTYSVVYDITDSFAYDSGTDSYVISRTFNSSIPSSDVVLVYRESGTSNGSTIWQQIPRTLYLDEGELDYDFDFSTDDVYIYAGGTIDLASQSSSFNSSYLNDQTFRIVIVPASYGKGGSVDYSDYEKVIKKYGIDDSKVVTLKK